MSLVDQAHTTPGRVNDMPEQRRRSYTGSSSDSCSPPSSEASPTSDTYEHELIDRYRADMMNSGPVKPSTRAPALPSKSARRASRFLDISVPVTSRPQSKSRSNPSATPYDVYLSSEEDASSSADDFSDFDDLDSENEDHKKHRHGYSIAITARVVSVIFSGKPSIVELPTRSRKSGSSEGLIRRAETEPVLTRRLSTSSTSSITMFHPPRSSSRVPTSIDRAKRPTFLNTDPFPSKAGEDIERPVTPLTPSAMFKRGLSLVKKRSRPQLSPAGFYSQSKENFSVQTLPADPEEVRQSRLMTDGSLEAKSPGYYQDIMRTARRKPRGLQEPDTASIMSSNTTNLSKLRAGFSLGRRRSIKA